MDNIIQLKVSLKILEQPFYPLLHILIIIITEFSTKKFVLI